MASNFTRVNEARNLGATSDTSVFLRSASIAGQKTGQVEIGALIILDRDSASRSARSQFCAPVERLKDWLGALMTKRDAKITLKRETLLLKFTFFTIKGSLTFLAKWPGWFPTKIYHFFV